MTGFDEPPRLVGWIDFDQELIQVSGRTHEKTALWLLRFHPMPRIEYGSVHDLLGEPVYEPSAWTVTWPEQQRLAVAEATAVVFRSWIADGCPTTGPLRVVALSEAVAS